jgi:metal-sulfur cluster biosynthetic enzyme
MTTTINDNLILETLRQVMDPELNCNIVDLGLIYSIAIDGGRVTVSMTLTTPGCPMSQMISEGVQWALLGLDGIEDAEVKLVWEPRWNPSMMTEAGRKRVGYR